jgi:hypothetical protein
MLVEDDMVTVGPAVLRTGGPWLQEGADGANLLLLLLCPLQPLADGSLGHP